MRRLTAQDHLNARNAHLRRSLQDHADRVAKRRAADYQPAQPVTVGDRMQALRDRVAARQRARQGGDGQTSWQAVAGQAGGGEGSSGPSHVANDAELNMATIRRTSNEDDKMHQFGPARRIHDATADRHGRSEDGYGALEAGAAAGAAGRQEDGRPREGDPLVPVVISAASSVPPAGAAVAAAHQVAWHTADGQLDSAT